MIITQQIITDFRDYYPEFSDVSEYSDKAVRQALQNGDKETGFRWGSYRVDPASIKAKGMFAFAAHELVMGKRRENGDIGTAYPVSGKSVGDESVSFSVPSVSQDDLILNGELSLTSYGLEFLRLRRKAAAGPLML